MSQELIGVFAIVLAVGVGTAKAQVGADDIQPESIGASYSAMLRFAETPAGQRGPVATTPSRVELTVEPPTENLLLPQVSQDRLFGTLRLGRTGKVYLLLDRSDAGQPWFDRLIIDANTNRDFRDDAVLTGRSLHSDLRKMGYTEFTAVTLNLYYGHETNENFAFTFYSWYPRSGSLKEMFYTSASWREGDIEIDGQAMRIGVFDNDSDGMFTIKHAIWSLVPADKPGLLFAADTTRPAAIPIRVNGVPYRVAKVMPEGRHVELTAETESRTREAELSYDPISSEPLRPLADQRIQWGSDLDLAVSAARTEGKKVFLLLAVDWSKECSNLMDRTFADQEVVTLLSDHFICVKVNPDHQPEFLTRYDLRATPTCLVLNRDGQAVERVVGYRQSRTMATLLRRYR